MSNKVFRVLRKSQIERKKLNEDINLKKQKTEMEIQELNQSINELLSKSRIEKSSSRLSNVREENYQPSNIIAEESQTREEYNTDDDVYNCSPIASRIESDYRNTYIDNDEKFMEHDEYFDNRAQEREPPPNPKTFSPLEKVFAKLSGNELQIERSIDKLKQIREENDQIRRDIVNELISLENSVDLLRKYQEELGLEPLKYDSAVNNRDQLLRCVVLFGKSIEIDKAILEEIIAQRKDIERRYQDLREKYKASPPRDTWRSPSVMRDYSRTPSQLEQQENHAIKNMYDRLSEMNNVESKKKDNDSFDESHSSKSDRPPKGIRSPNDPVERGIAKPVYSPLTSSPKHKELLPEQLQEMSEAERIEFLQNREMEAVQTMLHVTTQYKFVF